MRQGRALVEGGGAPSLQPHVRLERVLPDAGGAHLGPPLPWDWCRWGRAPHEEAAAGAPTVVAAGMERGGGELGRNGRSPL
jgi:hypothetical protein